MNDKTLRALSVAMFAAALAACGGGSSSSSGGGSSSSSGSSTITILYSFGGSDGANPEGTLIQGSDGNFYGTTDAGGSSANCTGGCGTIFEFSPSSGTETVLYSFGKSGDGTSPTGLILGSDGNFYGTTVYGGSSANCTSGCGTIFEFSPSSGTETVLYSFTGSNGANPQGGLVQGGDGNLYGTTVYGGTSENCASGCGTVFGFSPMTDTVTVLYSFTGGSDGTFYGTTNGGGGTTCSYGCGTIFEFSPMTDTVTVLYSFAGVTSDGSQPFGPIQVSDGNLYGTTLGGGASGNCAGGCGTIFEFLPGSGTETVLYSFGKSGDGVSPNGLILGSDGNFYGTTLYGGTFRGCTYKCGTIFGFAPSSGAETILHDFGSFSGDGKTPFAGSLILGSDGNLYGTTFYGGTDNDGTFFKVAP